MECKLDKLPAELPEHITCRMCQKPMRLIRLSDYVCFWVHDSDEAKVCRHLAFKVSYMNFLQQQFREKEENLSHQIIKEKKQDEKSEEHVPELQILRKT